MADEKISAMPAASALAGTELIPIVQSAANVVTTPAATNTYVRSTMGTGVSTFLTTPTSANLAAALTDETGSGAAVFATSPTLVTPVLGTPASGTLTNATGLPEGGLALTDITTNNVSTTKHGFAPKAPNDATKYLDGTGAYSVPAGGGGGTPGGSNTQVQYNNSGAFGGITGATTNGTAMTLVAPVLGTPASGTLTNCGGTASSLTSGITLALKSATTTVDVSAATAPTANQVLTATDGTHATWATPGGGSGTVTHTGTLTANAIMLGNAGADITALGSLGTTTTLLHGNAAGAPTFGAVNLATDVTGVLPTVINAQTGTSYTVVAGDQGKLVTLSNGSAIAVTLPQATGSFTTGWSTTLLNLGAGLVTITPTTSTINGAATIVLATGQSITVVSDGANYQGTFGGGRVSNTLRSATTLVDVAAATAPSANQVLTATGSTAATWQTPASLTNIKLAQIVLTIGDGVNAISANDVSFPIPCVFAGAITAYTIAADAGTCTIKTWKKATGTAIPTISDVISTSGVALSTGTLVRSATVSDFTTTTVTANDVFKVQATAVATAKLITFTLEITKT